MDIHYVGSFLSDVVAFFNQNGKTTLGENAGSIIVGGLGSRLPTWVDIYRGNIDPNHPMNSGHGNRDSSPTPRSSDPNDFSLSDVQAEQLYLGNDNPFLSE